MNNEMFEKIIEFCSLTNFENRRKAIADPLFMEEAVILELQNLIDDEDNIEGKLNYLDHKDLFILYQQNGISELDYFVSYYQIVLCFSEFCFGFDTIRIRNDFLLKYPILMDQKSIKYINKFITIQKSSDEYITIYRYYRNLLKACRILGINEAFEEFDIPDTQYIDAFNALLRSDNFVDMVTTNRDIYKDTIKSKFMRNVLHSYQAKYENNQLKRNQLIALWDSISEFQTLKRQVWFWEQSVNS